MIVSNEPVYIERVAYNRAVYSYVRKVKSVPGVLSVNLMGSVNAPGLSDIDVIVVVEDGFKSFNSEALATKDIDSRIFLHGPIVIPSSMVKDLQKIVYASNLSVVAGDNVLPTFDDLDSKYKAPLSWCYLVDFLESRFLQFAGITDVIDKRTWLTRVWSVTHSCYLFKNILREDLTEIENEWLSDITLTRDHWLERQKVSNEIFLRAVRSAKKLNESIFLRALKELYGKPLLDRDYCFYNGHKRFCFSNKAIAPEYSIRKINIFGRSLDYFLCAQVPAYLAHVKCYREDLKCHWIKGPNINSSVAEVMRERHNIVLRHRQWLTKHAPAAGSMAGYLGVNPGKRIHWKERAKMYIGKALA